MDGVVPVPGYNTFEDQRLALSVSRSHDGRAYGAPMEARLGGRSAARQLDSHLSLHGPVDALDGTRQRFGGALRLARSKHAGSR